MLAPQHLKYTPQHLWVSVEGNRAIVGITDYAQIEAGLITFVELPEVEHSFAAGEPFGCLEAVEREQELVMPVSGRVTAVNIQLEKDPSSLHMSPYHQGWLIAVELADPAELGKLWSAEQYIEASGGEQ